MSAFLEAAAGLVGGLETGLTKRAERERLERERLDRLTNFEQQLALQAERVALQERMTEVQERDATRRERESELQMQRLMQQLDVGQPVMVEGIDPQTGEAKQVEMTRAQIMERNFQNALQSDAGLTIQTAQGPLTVSSRDLLDLEMAVSKQERERERALQDAQTDALRTLLTAKQGSFGQETPLIADPSIRRLVEEQVNRIHGIAPQVPVGPSPGQRALGLFDEAPVSPNQAIIDRARGLTAEPQTGFSSPDILGSIGANPDIEAQLRLLRQNVSP